MLSACASRQPVSTSEVGQSSISDPCWETLHLDSAATVYQQTVCIDTAVFGYGKRLSFRHVLIDHRHRLFNRTVEISDCDGDMQIDNVSLMYRRPSSDSIIGEIVSYHRGNACADGLQWAAGFPLKNLTVGAILPHIDTTDIWVTNLYFEDNLDQWSPPFQRVRLQKYPTPFVKDVLKRAQGIYDVCLTSHTLQGSEFLVQEFLDGVDVVVTIGP